jgi:hypothetical protein
VWIKARNKAWNKAHDVHAVLLIGSKSHDDWLLR